MIIFWLKSRDANWHGPWVASRYVLFDHFVMLVQCFKGNETETGVICLEQTLWIGLKRQWEQGLQLATPGFPTRKKAECVIECEEAGGMCAVGAGFRTRRVLRRERARSAG